LQLACGSIDLQIFPNHIKIVRLLTRLLHRLTIVGWVSSVRVDRACFQIYDDGASWYRASRWSVRPTVRCGGDALTAIVSPKTPLARAIVFVLILKLIGLAGIKIFMFPDSAQPVIDAAAMTRAIGPVESLR
jgi:hypothetical protein